MKLFLMRNSSVIFSSGSEENFFCTSSSASSTVQGVGSRVCVCGVGVVYTVCVCVCVCACVHAVCVCECVQTTNVSTNHLTSTSTHPSVARASSSLAPSSVITPSPTTHETSSTTSLREEYRWLTNTAGFSIPRRLSASYSDRER